MRHVSLVRRSGLGFALIALSFGSAISGCKEAPKADTAPGSASAQPAASGSAAATTASGPCAEFASKVCAQAGSQSPTCQAVTTTSELMAQSACTAALKDVSYTLSKLGEQRKPCDELVGKLCGEFGAQSEICGMVTTKTKEFPPAQCSEMLKNVAEVVKELRQVEASTKPLSPEDQAKLTQGPAPSFGPESAKVTVVEFSDFECPYCSRAADVAHQIREKYGDRVRFVFRQFPLSFHPNAKEAAEASLAAHAQGKFWPFHDQLFKNQRALDRASLENYAKEAGLNVATFKQALDSDKYLPQVEADLKLGEAVHVNGTPSMFVNGKRVDNPTSFEAVAALIEAALAGKAG